MADNTSLSDAERLALMQVAATLLVDAVGETSRLNRLDVDAGAAAQQGGTYAALATVFDRVAAVYLERKGPRAAQGHSFLT